MELAYQGLFIRLPFEGAVGVEAFEMNASFNDHVTLRLLLLVEEEKIEALIHGIGDGDDIEVYKAEADGLLYAGKITDAKMEQDRSLHLLQPKQLLIPWNGACTGKPELSELRHNIQAGYGQGP